MFKPINGYVVVKRKKAAKTEKGILLPENITEGYGSIPGDGNKQPVITGEIIAVSEGSKLKPGDIVSYRQTTVYEIFNLETGEKAEIIKEEHIFGVWEKSP